MALAAAVPRGQGPRLKLYEATAELETVREFLLETEGELTPELEELLAHASETFDAKAERVALMIRELQGEQAAHAAQADALTRTVVEPHRLAAQRAGRAADALKRYLAQEMERAGRPKIAHGLVRLTLANNATPSVAVPTLDEEHMREAATLFPAFVRHIPESFEFDTEAIRAAWRADATVALPDGVVVTRGKHVRIL